MSTGHPSNGSFFGNIFAGPPGGVSRGPGGMQPPRMPRPAAGGTNSAPQGGNKTLGMVVAIIAVLIAVVGVMSKVWAELAWYQQLGRISVVLTAWGWRIGLVVVAMLLAAAVTWVNLMIAAQASPDASQRGKAKKRRNAERKMDAAKRQAQRNGKKLTQIPVSRKSQTRRVMKLSTQANSQRTVKVPTSLLTRKKLLTWMLSLKRSLTRLIWRRNSGVLPAAPSVPRWQPCTILCSRGVNS